VNTITLATIYIDELYKLVHILSLSLLLLFIVVSFYCCSLPYGE